jgi:hypothetical protein
VFVLPPLFLALLFLAGEVRSHAPQAGVSARWRQQGAHGQYQQTCRQIECPALQWSPAICLHCVAHRDPQTTMPRLAAGLN